MAGWAYADIGFDTGRQVWTVQLIDAKNRGAGNLVAKSIELRNVTSFQAAWPDDNLESPRNFWHVRQRILSESVSRIETGDKVDGDTITIHGVRGLEPSSSEAPFPLPDGTQGVEMAYSLRDSKGFVLFVGGDGKAVKEVRGRWLMTENLTMRTVGAYPGIRLRAEAADVHGLVVTGTACVVVGRSVV